MPILDDIPLQEEPPRGPRWYEDILQKPILEPLARVTRAAVREALYK